MADEKRVIFAGYVCEVVDHCNCAGGGEWPHEPQCGLEPLHLVEERPADDPPDEIVCNGRDCGGFPHG